MRRVLTPTLLALAIALIATGCVVKQTEKEVVTTPAAGNRDCWVKVYDDGGFDEDDSFATIIGPVNYTSLDNVEGKNWTNQIESLIVGPSATVKVWKDRSDSNAFVTFQANQRVDQLGEMDLADDIEAMEVTCR